MAEEIVGEARAWLNARRDELNARFRLAQRRYPRLDGALVLRHLSEILPPLAGKGDAGAGELLFAAYELILLQAGRGLLGEPKKLSAGSETFAGVLLRETFPKIRSLLLKRPRALMGALSNAAENLGERGVAFARALGAFGGDLEDADQLLDAGVVLAWRMGEPRLRSEAFIAGAKLPPRAALRALGLSGWPERAAELAFSALQADAWRTPEALFTPATLNGLAKRSAAEFGSLRKKLVEAPPEQPAAWRENAALGNFSGFGGAFDEPPLLLGDGRLGNRHRLWVLSTEGVYRIEADVFGWVCVPDPHVDLPVQEVKPRQSKLSALLKGKIDSPQLYPDGRLESVAYGVDLPQAAGAATFACGPGLLAFTHPESFRVRVLTPERTPL
ncbi:MAG: hypothetical protein HY291_22790 [Planctomycetes bacterium]|nr:hypothetical protein [Planctomycetota bacterium]